MTLKEGLKVAITNEEFYIHYQPQFDLHSKNMVGLEALLRWHHPKLGSVSPAEFIPLAEETGSIVSIGKWVLRSACEQTNAWQRNGHPLLKIAVNVSAYQLTHPSFLEDLKQIIQETELEPEFLELEITESLMLDATYAAFILKELKKIGVSISIDDFGTGYSSLSSINQLPIDRIKIDKTFINSMLSNSKEKTLVKAMVEMGRNLNVELVAEGVEYEEQEKALRDLKCHMGQGYLYSPPVSINEIENMLTLVKVESTVI